MLKNKRGDHPTTPERDSTTAFINEIVNIRNWAKDHNLTWLVDRLNVALSLLKELS